MMRAITLFVFLVFVGAGCSGASDAERAAAMANEILAVAHEGRVDDAVTLSREFVRRYPAMADAWLLLGSMAGVKAYGGPDIDSSDVVDYQAAEEALRAFEKGFSLDPSDRMARVGYARILTDLGEHEKAVPNFREAYLSKKLRTHQVHRYHVIQYVRALEALGRVSEASAELQRFVEDNPLDHSLMADYYSFQRKLGESEARAAIGWLIRFSDDFDDEKETECYLNRRSGLFDEAKECYEELARDTTRSKHYRVEAYGALVNLALRKQDLQLAIRYGHEGVSAFLDEPYLRYQLGHAYYNDRQHLVAKRSYRRGLQLKGNRWESRDYFALMALGDTYWQLGDNEAAERTYRELENAHIDQYVQWARERLSLVHVLKPSGGKPTPRPEAWEGW